MRQILLRGIPSTFDRFSRTAPVTQMMRPVTEERTLSTR